MTHTQQQQKKSTCHYYHGFCHHYSLLFLNKKIVNVKHVLFELYKLTRQLRFEYFF